MTFKQKTVLIVAGLVVVGLSYLIYTSYESVVLVPNCYKYGAENNLTYSHLLSESGSKGSTIVGCVYQSGHDRQNVYFRDILGTRFHVFSWLKIIIYLSLFGGYLLLVISTINSIPETFTKTTLNEADLKEKFNNFSSSSSGNFDMAQNLFDKMESMKAEQSVNQSQSGSNISVSTVNGKHKIEVNGKIYENTEDIEDLELRKQVKKLLDF